LYQYGLDKEVLLGRRKLLTVDGDNDYVMIIIQFLITGLPKADDDTAEE
jgi:hypothetical protein